MFIYIIPKQSDGTDFNGGGRWGNNSCIHITCRFIRHRVSSGVLSVGCVEIRNCI